MGEKSTTQQLKTEVGDYITRMVALDEEYNPTPWLPSPGMLVSRVSERLAQAAFAITRYNDAPAGEDADEWVDAEVAFIGAAAIALSVIPHIHPDAAGEEPTAFKSLLIAELDKRVDEMQRTAGRLYEDADPDLWLRNTLALTTGACQAVKEFEDAISPQFGNRVFEGEDNPEDLDELDLEDEDDEDSSNSCCPRCEMHAMRSAIADSLFESAVMSAAAGQWFLDSDDLDESDDDEQDEHDESEQQDTPVEDDDLSTLGSELWLDAFPAPDFDDWDRDRRWGYRNSRASSSRRNHSRLSIAISDTPNAFARRLTSPSRRSR